MNGAYDQTADRLRDDIHTLRLLRDAQTEGSRNHQHFQDQINQRTAQLLDWQDRAGHLAQLDAMIRTARRDVATAQRAAQSAARPWAAAAGITGTLGGLLLINTLLFHPPAWMPIAATLLLATAVAALYASNRASRTRHTDVQAAHRHLATLTQQRAALQPISNKAA